MNTLLYSLLLLWSMTSSPQQLKFLKHNCMLSSHCLLSPVV